MPTSSRCCLADTSQTRASGGSIDAILIAISDHGAGAPSAATARMAATGNRHAPEAAVAAGILAIGDAPRRRRHGVHGDHRRRTRACWPANHVRWPTSRESTALEARTAGQRLPDLGHRMYREDPRTTVLFAMAEQHGKAGQGVAFMRALESAVAETIKPLPINVDGAIAGRPPRPRLSRRSRQADLHRRPHGGTGGACNGEYTANARCACGFRVVYDGPPPVDDAGRGRAAVTDARRVRSTGRGSFAASFVTFGLASGLPYYNIAFFYDYLRDDHHWTQQMVTMGAPIAILLTIWAGPLLAHRFNPRYLIVAGTGLTCLAFQWFGHLHGSSLEYYAAWCVYMIRLSAVRSDPASDHHLQLVSPEARPGDGHRLHRRRARRRDRQQAGALARLLHAACAARSSCSGCRCCWRGRSRSSC